MPADLEQLLRDEEASDRSPAGFLGWRRSGLRRAALAQLHEQALLEFEKAEDFGSGRMVDTTPSRDDLPADSVPLTPIELEPDEPEYQSSSGDSWEPRGPHAQTPAERAAQLAHAGLAGDEFRGDEVPAPPHVPQALLRDVHSLSVREFADPDRTGWVAGPRRAAGFQSHAMRDIRPHWTTKQLSQHYRIVRLELVSLLKQSIPRVYQSKHLPQMDELRRMPTRDLDPFEKDAVARLTREGLVWERFGATLRALGPIHARESCTQCHRVRRGDLLGAFSYELRMASPPEPRTKPQT